MGLRLDITFQFVAIFGLRIFFEVTPVCENVLEVIFLLKFCNLSQQEKNLFCNFYHFDKTSKRFFRFCSGWKKFQTLGIILTQENFDCIPTSILRSNVVKLKNCKKHFLLVRIICKI